MNRQVEGARYAQDRLVIRFGKRELEKSMQDQ